MTVRAIHWHQMHHIWDLISGPILSLGPLYRDRTGEFDSWRQRLLPGRITD